MIWNASFIPKSPPHSQYLLQGTSNATILIIGSGLHKLLSSPKLTWVFASGYVNTASVLYFCYKINLFQIYDRSNFIWILKLKLSKHVTSQMRQISQSCNWKTKPTRLTTFQFMHSQNIFTRDVSTPNPPTVFQLYKSNLEGNCTLQATRFEVQ